MPTLRPECVLALLINGTRVRVYVPSSPTDRVVIWWYHRKCLRSKPAPETSFFQTFWMMGPYWLFNIAIKRSIIPVPDSPQKKLNALAWKLWFCENRVFKKWAAIQKVTKWPRGQKHQNVTFIIACPSWTSKNIRLQKLNFVKTCRILWGIRRI